MKFVTPLLILQILVLIGTTMGVVLDDVFAWSIPEFAWVDNTTKEQAIANGNYIPENNVPLGLCRWKDKLFVTVPRWKEGGASSLNYIDLNEAGVNKSPVLKPYPSWEENTLPGVNETVSPEAIINTFRVMVDDCNRLWIMDVGKVNVLSDDPKVFLQPGIVIYDLNTDKFIRRYSFKPEDIREDSFFANIVVDSDENDCQNAFAYVSDPNAFGIVVYSYFSNDSWRIRHNFLHFDPLESDFTVGGVKFQWADGVFGVALSPKQPDGFKTAYFHPTASTKEFAVSTEVLQNMTGATSPNNYYHFKYIGDRGKDTQSSTSVFDVNTGVIFYSQIQRDGVACWNTRQKLKPKNFHLISTNHETMVFANEIKIDPESNYLWLMSNRMPQFLYRSLNLSDINIRIFRTPVQTVLKQSPCL